MIYLDGTQTVDAIRQSINLPNTNCIVKMHLEYGDHHAWYLEDARACYNVYRMEISEISNVIIIDMYNY